MDLFGLPFETTRGECRRAAQRLPPEDSFHLSEGRKHVQEEGSRAFDTVIVLKCFERQDRRTEQLLIETIGTPQVSSCGAHITGAQRGEAAFHVLILA